MTQTPLNPQGPDLAALLEHRLRDQPGAPLLTFYDDATGERTELSATSFANWTAKHANLLREELDLEDDDVVLLDLPTHWLVPVFLAGAWTAGLAVTADPEVAHAVVVTDLEGARRHASDPDRVSVLVCSLHPFALPVAEPLPPGALDHGHLWPGQSDVHVAHLAPDPDRPAWRSPDRTQRDLLAQAASAEEPGRLLTDAHPAEDQGVATLWRPLVTGGSTVLVSRADPGSWESRAAQERVDAVSRSAG